MKTVAGLIGSLVLVLLGLGMNIAIIYVIVHFITKFW